MAPGDNVSFEFEGKKFSWRQLSPEVKELVRKLHFLEQGMAEKSNLIAVMTKAKNAYIEDLKAEVLRNRSGIDFRF